MQTGSYYHEYSKVRGETKNEILDLLFIFLGELIRGKKTAYYAGKK